MIIIGDEHIDYETINRVLNIDDIKNSPSNSTVLFDFDISILKHTSSNNIKSAVIVSSIKEVIYASILDARFIIVNDNIASQTQDIAQQYMYDSKILMKIKNQDQLHNVAKMGIDGAIYERICI